MKRKKGKHPFKNLLLVYVFAYLLSLTVVVVVVVAVVPSTKLTKRIRDEKNIYIDVYSDNFQECVVPILCRINFSVTFLNQHVISNLTWLEMCSLRSLAVFKQIEGSRKPGKPRAKARFRGFAALCARVQLKPPTELRRLRDEWQSNGKFSNVD